jgi:hypothetical protein
MSRSEKNGRAGDPANPEGPPARNSKSCSRGAASEGAIPAGSRSRASVAGRAVGEGKGRAATHAPCAMKPRRSSGLVAGWAGGTAGQETWGKRGRRGPFPGERPRPRGPPTKRSGNSGRKIPSLLWLRSFSYGLRISPSPITTWNFAESYTRGAFFLAGRFSGQHRAGSRSPKAEARKPKEVRKPKPEGRLRAWLRASFSGFGFRISFGFRASGLRISKTRADLGRHDGNRLRCFRFKAPPAPATTTAHGDASTSRPTRPA